MISDDQISKGTLYRMGIYLRNEEKKHTATVLDRRFCQMLHAPTISDVHNAETLPTEKDRQINIK
jgi:peptide methionine sulfoxide reductase MsrA